MLMFNLLAIGVLLFGGFSAGVAVCCTYTGMTPHELHKATAASAARLWDRISSNAPTPVRAPVEPADHPLAPTLDDLADDAEADPICHAVATGAPFHLHDHPGLSYRGIVQHLEAHGRTYGEAIDQAAALLRVQPRSLETIIGRAWPRTAPQRPTTDAELTSAGWDVAEDGALFTPDQVLEQSHVFDNAGQAPFRAPTGGAV